MSIDLKREVREYCDFMEETQGPLTIEQILERSGAIQVIPDDEWNPRHEQARRRWAAVVAVAAILLTVGVALFIGALREDVPPVDSVPGSSTVPTPTTTPDSTPSSVPDSATPGTLVTPLGTFDWWQLTGVEPEVPPPSWLVKGPSGYSLIDGPWGTGLQYWRSADGRTWLDAESPGFEGDSAYVERIAGDYWLSTNAPSLWRSEDGETWVEVALPSGYSQTPYRSLYEVNDTIWLTGVEPVGVWLLDGTSWTALDPGSIAPGEVTELNGSTGVEGGPVAIGEITVVPWDFDTLSVLSSDGGATVIDLPWAQLRDQARDGFTSELAVVAANGQFLAYVTHYTSDECPPPPSPAGCEPGDRLQPVIEMWTSPDGVSWAGPTRPEFLADEGGANGSFRTDGDLIIAEVLEPSEGFGHVWISEDGVDWSATGIFGHSFEFIRLDSGAMYMADDPGSEMFFSADLRNWESVDTSALGAYGDQSESGRSMTSAAANSVSFMAGNEGTGRNDMWILELQE